MLRIIILITPVLCIALKQSVHSEHYDGGQIYHIPLDEGSEMTLDWEVDYHNKKIFFEVHLPNDFRWFAIGFSNQGESFPADYCILWNNWKGNLQFQKMTTNHAVKFFAIAKLFKDDERQLRRGEKAGMVEYLTFSSDVVPALVKGEVQASMKKRLYSVEDVLADETGMLSLDRQQDCLNLRIKQKDRITKFMYERKFDTCDPSDYVIEDGTTHIVWSKGNGPLYQVNGLNISTSFKDNGMVRTQLLKNTARQTPLPHQAKSLDILAENVPVPSDDTTYWCHVLKLPEEFLNKHHVLQYEAVIQKGNEGLVHHMEVFHCIAPANENVPLYVGSCFAPDRPKATQVCKRVLAAWAMGAKAFTYPQEAGLPIGGTDFNQFVMLEIHYNNPDRKSGTIDTSGIKFHVTSKLRPMDAGVIELGLEYTDKMAIPPQQPAFPLSGYCVSECTAVSLPPEGIMIFGSQLHTHLTGVRVYTRHIRNGRELPELNRDNHYSTHFQEIRRLKRLVNVLPGDALITTCDYNTENRENITLGGFAISDEMCVNYIHYFPSTPLEVCKSAISDQALTTYFEYMNEWENQPTSRSSPISSNYQAIKWNPIRVQLLQDVYKEAPLSMQCNMSSGNRFPGYWENTPLTPILVPLPPPVRHCNN